MARPLMLALALSVAGVAAGCGGAAPSEPVLVDGSSTVFPLSEAIALDYLRRHSSAQITVTFSGTDSGFDKFCRGGLDIVDASRPITAPEQDLCAANRVDFVELPVARDAITVIVNARNTWAASMTVAELRTLWSPEAQGKITRWSQVRKGWPDRQIALFGPGPESGTFDYFTAAINGGARASRKDYVASGDDSIIVRGVATDEYALGYVGYGYFDRARSELKSVAIDDLDDSVGQGPSRLAAERRARSLPAAVTHPVHLRQPRPRRAARSAAVRGSLPAARGRTRGADGHHRPHGQRLRPGAPAVHAEPRPARCTAHRARPSSGSNIC